jgi:hypothetical protein
MMKKFTIFTVILLLCISSLYAQVRISNEPGEADPSAILDVQSTDKGFLPPRMTLAQRNAISNPAEGLTVFCTDCDFSNTSAVTMFSNGMWHILYDYCLIFKPSEGTHVPGLEQITWNWNPAAYATGYRWNFEDDFSTSIDMGTNTSYTELELNCLTSYSSYVWAYNACGDVSYVTVLNAATLVDNPDPPVAGTQIPYYDGIEWNWNVVPEATGYFFNYTNDYMTAANLGSSLSYYETGLDCGTSYTSYVWAYSACGISESITLTQATEDCWECGDPFDIYHQAGDVAPVNKYVTYGTVTGIPGEPDKCWLSQNLGADQQAEAANDATEPSGGWYWQFNLKQGYMYEYPTLTPSWTITGITQVSHWAAYNDPCVLEIGAGFRIPTYTEWDNVKTAGLWTDWNGPWASDLKLHAAGFISYVDGELYYPGVNGTYWSSTWSSSSWGWTLDFSSSSCSIYSWEMAYGYSVRCIRNE